MSTRTDIPLFGAFPPLPLVHTLWGSHLQCCHTVWLREIRAVIHPIELTDKRPSEPEPRRLIDVAGFKDLAGVSRQYAIPLLECLDREHVTRRAGEQRMIN